MRDLARAFSFGSLTDNHPSSFSFSSVRQGRVPPERLHISKTLTTNWNDAPFLSSSVLLPANASQ